MRLALHLALALLASTTVSTSASAQVSPVPQFQGQAQEGFDTQPNGFNACFTSFGGAGQVCTVSGAGLLATSSWGFVCTMGAHSGGKFCGSATGPVQVTFTSNVHRFGGWFGTNSGGSDAHFDFYDANDQLISSELALFPNDCTWRWFGWQSCSAAIRRVVITGLTTPAGAFVDMDELQVDFTPPPTCNPGPLVYCTAGTSTAGCTASISASAQPRANFQTPCQISVTSVEGQRTGIVFYGLGALPQPWCSPGSSFLCVKSPTQRTLALGSGGTFGVCNGSISLDWNAFHLANPGGLGTPFYSGQKVYVQAWFRDPPACKTTTLSNALELVMQ